MKELDGSKRRKESIERGFCDRICTVIGESMTVPRYSERNTGYTAQDKEYYSDRVQKRLELKKRNPLTISETKEDIGIAGKDKTQIVSNPGESMIRRDDRI